MSYETMREGEWGWPIVTIAVHPAPGDTVELPTGDTATFHRDDGHAVYFGIGKLDEWGEYEDGGHLRTSATCDGLFLYRGGRERDGYSCHVVKEGFPGRRHWKVVRGRKLPEAPDAR